MSSPPHSSESSTPEKATSQAGAPTAEPQTPDIPAHTVPLPDSGDEENPDFYTPKQSPSPKLDATESVPQEQGAAGSQEKNGEDEQCQHALSAQAPGSQEKNGDDEQCQHALSARASGSSTPGKAASPPSASPAQPPAPASPEQNLFVASPSGNSGPATTSISDDPTLLGYILQDVRTHIQEHDEAAVQRITAVKNALTVMDQNIRLLQDQMKEMRGEIFKVIATKLKEEHNKREASITEVTEMIKINSQLNEKKFKMEDTKREELKDNLVTAMVVYNTSKGLEIRPTEEAANRQDLQTSISKDMNNRFEDINRRIATAKRDALSEINKLVSGLSGRLSRLDSKITSVEERIRSVSTENDSRLTDQDSYEKFQKEIQDRLSGTERSLEKAKEAEIKNSEKIEKR
jgi:chromosome segregation ATPase